MKRLGAEYVESIPIHSAMKIRYFEASFPQANDDDMLTEFLVRLGNKWFNFVVSHVVGVLKDYYLLSYAGSALGQHCCMVATANIYKSQQCALLNSANKGIA